MHAGWLPGSDANMCNANAGEFEQLEQHFSSSGLAFNTVRLSWIAECQQVHIQRGMGGCRIMYSDGEFISPCFTNAKWALPLTDSGRSSFIAQVLSHPNALVRVEPQWAKSHQSKAPDTPLWP